MQCHFNRQSHTIISNYETQMFNLTFLLLVTTQQARLNAEMISFTTPRKGDCHSNRRLPW